MARLTNPVKERNRSLECLHRRRGSDLLSAIYQATIGELAAEGFTGLTFEAVALRAQTGKASLYRRWKSKVDLVIDALAFEINKCETPLDLRDLRTGLISKMNSMCLAFGGDLGRAMAGCFSEFQRQPKLQQAAEAQIINPRKAQLMRSLEEAEKSGQIRSGKINPMVADLPIAFVMKSITFEGRPPSGEEIEDFVDSVMLPILR